MTDTENGRGLVHIYCGDGKGKTTAAVGLAVRAAGSGMRVLFVQFLKDGTSSECAVLRTLPGVTVEGESPVRKFSFAMTGSEKTRCLAYNNTLLQHLQPLLEEENRLVVLDECIGAIGAGLLDEAPLTALLQSPARRAEVVLTGREPSAALQACADYISEMRKVRHPYDRGIAARKGIEL